MDLLPVLIYIVICIACILGNTLVVLSVFTYKPLQSVQNYFIVSLAIADFLVAICVVPFHITLELTEGEWIFDLYTCHFFLTIDIMLCTSSILNLCCIALDRYWAIKDSIKYAQKRTKARVLTMIGLAWGLSLIISLPVIYMNTSTVKTIPLRAFFNNETYVGASIDILNCDISYDKLYRIYSSMGTFFVPVLVMTFVYIRIYMETKKRLRERSLVVNRLAQSMAKSLTQAVDTKRTSSDTENQTSLSPPCHSNGKEFQLLNKEPGFMCSSTTSGTIPVTLQDHRRSINAQTNTDDWKLQGPNETKNMLQERQKISLNRERRAARTLGFIMGSIIICWLPFFCLYLLQAWGYFMSNENVFQYLTLLGYVNSALNPIIYTIFNEDFRKSFKRILILKRFVTAATKQQN